jgi:hypothetical protein
LAFQGLVVQNSVSTILALNLSRRQDLAEEFNAMQDELRVLRRGEVKAARFSQATDVVTARSMGRKPSSMSIDCENDHR